MGLRIIADTTDDLPKPFQNKGTTQEDGTILLDLSQPGFEGVTVGNMEKLQNAAAKFRVKFEEAEEKIAGFNGIDLEKYNTAIEAAKAAKNGAKNDEDVESRIVARVEEATRPLQSKIEELSGANETLGGELNDNARRLAIEECLTLDGTIPRALRAALQEKLSVEVIDGKRQAVILGADGYLRDEAQAPLPPRSYVEERMRPDPEYAWCFAGPGTSGGGGDGTETQVTATGNRKQVSKSDPLAMGQHAQEIIDGSVEVVD